MPSVTLPGVIVLGLIVAALWGVSDFLGGLASRRASALLVVVIAHSLSMAMLVLIALGMHAHLPSERTVVWALLTGLSGGGALIVFYQALAMGEMGLTAALTGLLTALVPVVFSWLSEGRPTTTQLLGFVIAAVAICLIAYEPHGRMHPRGIGLATIAGLGFGAFLVASKFASQGAVLWPLAYSRITSAVLAGAMLLGVHLQRKFKDRGSSALAGGAQPGDLLPVILLAGAAGILEAAGNLLYMVATRLGRLDVAAVLSSLYPAGPILLGAWMLKERTTAGKALGMALALVAVVVISL